MKCDTELLLDGLVFPECPRWQAGKLWFSDMIGRKVMSVDLSGNVETIVKVPGQPAGLGWLPDGALLIVSMTDRKLLRYDSHSLSEIADLSQLASFHLNDMVIDSQGRSYIGNFGFDIHSITSTPSTANVILVTQDGNTKIVADNLLFPNGSVITPDEQTYIVAESLAQKLTAFTIHHDGTLTNQRTWAQLDGLLPDGICLDAEGAVWIASATDKDTSEVMRITEGGKVTHRIKPSNIAFACILGGPDRRTLFIATADTSNPEKAFTKQSGRIEYAEVDVPGAGFP